MYTSKFDGGSEKKMNITKIKLLYYISLSLIFSGALLITVGLHVKRGAGYGLIMFAFGCILTVIAGNLE